MPAKTKTKAKPVANAKAASKPRAVKTVSQEDLISDLCNQLRALNKTALQLPFDGCPPNLILGPEDVSIVYDIKLVSHNEVLTHLKGRQDLPSALAPSLRSHVMKKFTTVFAAIIGEPIAAALQSCIVRLTQPQVQSFDRPPSLSMLNQLPGFENMDGGFYGQPNNSGYLSPDIDNG